MPDLSNWPAWGADLVWTLVTLGVSWGIGHLLGVVLMSRLSRWFGSRHEPMARYAVQVVRKRLPWWFLFLGVWLSAGFWSLTAEGRLLVEQAVFVLVAASVTLAVAAIASHSLDAYSSIIAPGVGVSSLTRNVVWVLVVTIGLLMAISGLGLSVTPVLTFLGVGGLAVALAVQEPLANFFAGLTMTLAGQIRVGDYVRLDSGEQGYVADFSWRSTRLRMLANNLVVVPNAKLAQAILVNYHLPSQDMAVLVEVGVDYASDLRRVEQVVIGVGREVMLEVPGGVAEFEPFIRYHTFGDSSIDFTVILRAREFVDQYLIKHEFIKRLHERFDREGIVIPFPIRTIVERSVAPGPALPA